MKTFVKKIHLVNASEHSRRAIIIIIIMHYNNIFSGNFWAIVGPKLSGPTGDPDYPGSGLPKVNCIRYISSGFIDGV
jgi:hypothetical protein